MYLLMYYTVKIWMHQVLNPYIASSYFLFIPPCRYTAPFVKFQVLKFLYDQQWFKPFGHLFVLILRLWETQKCFLFTVLLFLLGFPGGSGHKKSACKCRRRGFNPWVGKIPLEKEKATHSSILAWRIPGMEEPGRL